ncbi:hypothetical protein KHP62_20470 [Rhodobacteraceae bacterium NNCM2]|nr:hypothetical protein [Coraliihabitans acroporae]
MRVLFLAIAMAAIGTAADADSPTGWETCRGMIDDASVWQACAQEVSAECVALRAEEGDDAWVACLQSRALDWEAEVVRQSTALKERNNPAGASSALSRWLAGRSTRCHARDQIDRMIAEYGETQAAAAVYTCELASNIQEAVRLSGVAER